MLVNMKELLRTADANGFAVPAFNISNYAMFNGIMDISERLNAPVILEIHPNELKHIGTDFIAGMKSRAAHSPVPVVIHLDHGASFENVMTAIRAGFTSVMIDASSKPFEENIAICQKVVEAAHGAVNYIKIEDPDDPRVQGNPDYVNRHYAPSCYDGDVSVEGELGTIGSINEAAGQVDDRIVYTEPEDAVKFVAATGIDTLAIAIGTSHGLYPKGYVPHLQIDRLKAIHKALRDAGYDTCLVLHGGSGNPDDEIAEAARNGIAKINISSDIKVAYYDKMREVLKDLGKREPNAIENECISAMQEVAAHKIRLFGADGKAALYR